MRGVLAEETVIVASIEEDCQIVVSDLRARTASILGVASSGSGWTEPSRAAIGHMWVEIVVEDSLLCARVRSVDTVWVDGP